jgi:pimeloyl-ACP methyl ester carboxylesterase
MDDKLYDRDEVCSTYFFPQPDSPLPRDDRSGPVGLALPDGTPIGGYWCHTLDSAPTLLYLHGNGERIADQLDHWPRWARDAGVNIFFVDYPGYASSAGAPTFSSCCQAARAGLEYLLARPASEVPAVLVMGRSVGSIFALDAAASAADEARVRGLALESGVADLRPRLDMRLDYERLGLDRAAVHEELERDFDHRDKVRRAGVPLLVLHTRHDGLVPCDNGEKLADWAGDLLHELVLFDRGDHNSIQYYNEAAYREALAGWVAACAAPADAAA